MLKYLQKLRLRSKGCLNHKTNLSLRRVEEKVLGIIPILSIFTLLGIISYTIINPSNLANLLSNVDGEVYAADTSNNTSLIIDNGTATSSTAIVRNGVAYSSHTVQVKADNITGYILSITGPASLSNGSTTIGGAGGKTGTQLASADTGWGYGWNTTSTTNANMTYNSFTGSVQTLSGDSVSNNSVNFTRKLVFAAKFDQNAAEGHYRANVTLNLTATPRTIVNYSVNYNMNGGSGGPSNTSGTANGTSYTYTIPTTKPTKTGYKLEGYSDNNSTVAKYQPGNTITLNSTTSSVTLYAIWKLTEFPSSLTTMQGMTPEICDSVATGVSKALTDSGRGNTSYTVRKLADGNCWMVDNLKLNLNSYSLTSTNSDVTTTKSTGWATNVTTASNWSETNTDNKAQFNMNGFGSASYNSSYGYYYSWYAATAGTGTYSMSSDDAPSSICPKGWKLPKGGSGGDFKVLYNKNTSAAAWATENSLNGRWLGAASADAGGAFFPAAGRVYPLGLSNGGTFGYYLSRTANGSSNASYLGFDSSGVNPVNSFSKHSGYSVRCVAYSDPALYK